MQKVTVYFIAEGTSKPEIFKAFEAQNLYINVGPTGGNIQVSESTSHVLFSGNTERFIAVREPKS